MLAMRAAAALVAPPALFAEESDRGGTVRKSCINTGANYTYNCYYSPNPRRGVFGLLAAPAWSDATSLRPLKFCGAWSADAPGCKRAGSEPG